MTTNHRPTLESKRGKVQAISDSIAHARNLPQQTRLKYRRDHLDDDGTEIDPVRAKRGVDELKRELLIREGKLDEHEATVKRLKIRQDETDITKDEDSDDSDSDDEEALLEELKRVREGMTNGGDSENSHNFDNDNNNDNEENDDEPSEEDSDTEQLLAELNQIKKERQEAKDKLAEEEKTKKALSSNPLVSIDSQGAKEKKSWRNSTAFSKKPEPPKDDSETFTNDTLHSETHQKFLSKFIR